MYIKRIRFKRNMNAVAGKVALITGGGAGIGLCYAKELLRNGLKVTLAFFTSNKSYKTNFISIQAVTLAEVNKENGHNALKQLQDEFGSDRAIFVKTDVTDKGQFEGKIYIIFLFPIKNHLFL